MSAWVVYGLATWPFLKVEVRRYVCSSHHWPLRWPSTNDERDGPLLIPFDSGFPTYTHTHTLSPLFGKRLLRSQPIKIICFPIVFFIEYNIYIYNFNHIYIYTYIHTYICIYLHIYIYIYIYVISPSFSDTLIYYSVDSIYIYTYIR